jgi:hypothetical protein
LGESHQIRTEESQLLDEPAGQSAATLEQEGNKRWGSGEVSIYKATMLDEFGNPTLNLVSGRAVTIQIDYTVHQPIDEIVVGIRISHLHGLTIWGTNTKRRPHILKLQKGSGKVQFTLERLPLLEGTFDLTVAISDRTEVNAYDHRENLLRFNVLQKGTYDEGTTRFDGLWTN